MSVIFWATLLVIKYFCLFSVKSISLGIFLLLKRFRVRLLISIHSIRWYGLLFFLIYVGGLLVLFVYISSLKFNPTFHLKNIKNRSQRLLKVKALVLVGVSLTQITWNFKGPGWAGLEYSKFSLKLFKECEILFLVNVGLLLLIVLWIITKLSFQSRGALRPFF